MTASDRADWRRNHDALLASAADVVAAQGADASLEEIARRAGVGSATLHRHFASRRALLEAVFHDGIVRLAQRAEELARQSGDPDAALRTWLAELTDYTTSTRGVTTVLLTGPEAGIDEQDTCRGLLGQAGQALVERAAPAGLVDPATRTSDLIALTNAISLAGDGDDATTQRLLDLALVGITRASPGDSEADVRPGR